MSKEFKIENYKCTDKQLVYWIKLLNVNDLVKEINRVEKVIKNIFGYSKPLNNKKKK